MHANYTGTNTASDIHEESNIGESSVLVTAEY
ncbi:hypothetical protein D2E26_0185 [Bifidobacterium dolichotidis]|uniref:Uncharacterized protein n=1 Tax=Bifidobacterium dolichotidis TaxID=2306976 RepID=A0A430FRW3_9BIFI|nr:hypothetical protein D2E26_0185 [Bifidobacterium dolichotidis]